MRHLSSGHVQGLPRDGIMALLLWDSVRAQLLNELPSDFNDHCLTELDLELANNMFAVSRASGAAPPTGAPIACV